MPCGYWVETGVQHRVPGRGPFCRGPLPGGGVSRIDRDGQLRGVVTADEGLAPGRTHAPGGETLLGYLSLPIFSSAFF
ncbi:MAG: hypothetical protein ACJAQ3_001476 [Planctomycetota bacterium]|jgi:hypothetical protein